MNIRRLLILLSVLAILVITNSACIEVTSTTTINEDGSGSTTLSMDFAKFANKMGGSMFESGKLSPESFKEDMLKKMKEDGDDKENDSLRMAIEDFPGLHNYDFRFDEYAMVTKYDFDHVKEREKFMDESEMSGKLGSTFSELTLTPKGSKTVLTWASGFGDMKNSFGVGTDEEGEEKNEKLKQMFKPFLEGLKVTTIFHLPGKVKKVSDKANMTVSKDKRTVVHECALIDFVEGNVPVANTITYK